MQSEATEQRAASSAGRNGFRSSGVAVVLGVLAAFSLACAAWRMSKFGPGFPGSESYSTIARELLDTGSFQTAFRPPLYPLFLATMMRIFGANWEYAAVFVQALLSTAVGLTIYRLARDLGRSERAGMFAAALFLSNALYQFEATAKRETTLFTLCFLLFFWSALFVTRPATKYLILALTAALALLLRPNAIALLPVGALVLYFDIRKGVSPATIIAPAALFLALVVPWQLFVREVTGAYPLTTSANSGQVLWKGNYEHLLAIWPQADIDVIEGEMTSGIGGTNITTSEGDRLLKEQAVAFIKGNPSHALKLAAVKALAFFAPFPIPYGEGQLIVEAGKPRLERFRYRNKLLLVVSTLQSLIVMCGALAFVVTAYGQSPNHRLLALCCIIVTLVLLAIHTLSYPESRYRWPLDMLWTALAADYFSRKLWPSRTPK